jgi:hypothetical protein
LRSSTWCFRAQSGRLDERSVGSIAGGRADSPVLPRGMGSRSSRARSHVDARKGTARVRARTLGPRAAAARRATLPRRWARKRSIRAVAALACFLPSVPSGNGALGNRRAGRAAVEPGGFGERSTAMHWEQLGWDSDAR